MRSAGRKRASKDRYSCVRSLALSFSASFACCPGARFNAGEDHASRRTVVNTLKSAALLVVLLGVLYGVYVALNKPDPPEHAGNAPGDGGSPLIEYNRDSATGSSGSASPVGYDDPNAAASRSVRGGAYPSQLDSGAMPPPTTVPGSAPPLTTSGGLARSTYEAPADSPASRSAASPGAASTTSTAPQLELTPAASETAQVAADAASPALAAYALRRDLA